MALNQLEQLRRLIDELDHGPHGRIEAELEIVEQIGNYKAELGVIVFQLERWRSIIEDRMKFAEDQNIDPELVHGLWNEFIKRLFDCKRMLSIESFQTNTPNRVQIL